MTENEERRLSFLLSISLTIDTNQNYRTPFKLQPSLNKTKSESLGVMWN
jgi:hypothetical protein